MTHNDETRNGETDKHETGDGENRRFVGKKGKSGPKRGSENAMRHGLRAGKLPKDATYIEVRMNIFRRELEQVVIESKGNISIADAAYVQTAMRWERHAALAQRWLTKQYDEMKPEQRLTFSREIARASGERDKAIERLQLDRDATASMIDKLYLPHADGAGGVGDK